MNLPTLKIGSLLRDWKFILVGLVAVVLLAWVAWFFFFRPAPIPPKPQMQVAPEMEKLKDIPTEDRQLHGKIKVKKKADVIKKIPDIPQALKDDPNEQVISSSETKVAKKGSTVETLTFLNNTTNEVKTLTRVKEPSKFRFMAEGSWGLEYQQWLRSGRAVQADVAVDMIGLGSTAIGVKVMGKVPLTQGEKNDIGAAVRWSGPLPW